MPHLKVKRAKCVASIPDRERFLKNLQCLPVFSSQGSSQMAAIASSAEDKRAER